MGRKRTVEDETAQGPFDFELCVEDDDLETDWEHVVAAFAFEKGSYGMESVPVDLSDRRLVRGDMGGRAVSR
jgi:hypothetical protein